MRTKASPAALKTQFFVTLARDGVHTDYVLTIFEVLKAEQLPFYLELMQHLAQKGLPVPRPYADEHGALFRTLAGKPASLVSKLAGKDTSEPSPAHCASVGRTLAQMHLAVADFKGTQANLRGLSWWLEMQAKRWLNSCPSRSPHCSTTKSSYKANLHKPSCIAHYPPAQDTAICSWIMCCLPTRIHRHSSIFTLPAWIDSFDLAVTANDWCIDRASGEFLPEQLSALLQAYHLLSR